MILLAFWSMLHALPRIDLAVYSGWVGARSSGATALAIAVTDAGGIAAMASLAAAAAAWCWWRGRTLDAVLAVGAMAGAGLLIRLLKELFDRPRPPEATRLVVETNESLPSGHALMSVVVMGTLVVLAWAGRSVLARAAMTCAALAWVVAIGVTRLYLGVHWFSDVLAGWLVGAMWLALCVALWHRTAVIAATRA